jgi:hypothetical protein
MARRLTALLLAVLGLAACGGGNDKKDAERTVRTFVRATNDRDADTLCNDVFSKEFIEQATGASGDRARSVCKQQFKQLRGLKLRLVRISNTKIDGDKATVTTVIETQDQPQPRVFRLTKEDGNWRLAGGSGG